MAQVFSVQDVVGSPDRPTSLVASPLGDIQVLDVLSFAPWKQVSSSFTSWQGLEYIAGSGGCVSLSHPTVTSYLSLRDGDQCSSFDLLCSLKESGWQIASSGQRVPPFVPGGEKVMTLHRVTQRKSYLRCLLDIDRLFARGLTKLPHRDGDVFYSELFLADKPSSVLPLADRKEKPAAQAPAIEDKSSDVSSDGEMAPAKRGVVGSSDDEFAPAPREVVARRGARPAKQRRIAVADLDAELSSDGDQEDLAPPTEMAQVVQVPAPPVPVAAASSDPPVVAEDPEVFGPVVASEGGTVWFRGAPYVVLVYQLPAFVGGIKLARELRIDDECPQTYYDRVGVSCPLKASEHRDRLPCHRWRGLQMKRHKIFGDIDAVGFLGTWLNRACDCASKKEHMKFDPSPTAVVEYLLEHGFIKRA